MTVKDPLFKALYELKELGPQQIDLSLGRLTRLLEQLGNPQDHTPPVIHVGGTNGKGSTVANLRAIMEAAGYKCHVYTSPHLVRINERFVLAGETISDQYLLDLIAEVKAVNAGAEISFFEITTAMAFLAFSRIPADVLLLEVGLGGRLDATNVVSHPLLSVITTMSYDHVDFLGTTLEAIAGEKAGIMRAGTPCIVGRQMDWARDEVLPVFDECAARLGTQVLACDREWSVEQTRDGMVFRYGKASPLALPLPNLTGGHQVWNSGTAIAALKTQNVFKISDDAIRHGITHVQWAARMERITWISLLPGWEIWYDGGHNDSGGEMVARQAQRWHEQDGKPLHVICGMLKSKKPNDLLGPVISFVTSLSTVTFETGAFSETGPARTAEELAAEIRPHYPDVTTHASLDVAIKDICQRYARKPGRILVTGTLYAYKDLKGVA
jgi:dihydrofolate synthase/folylpolyglutamate synthase